MKKMMFILLYLLSPVLLIVLVFNSSPAKYLSTNLIYSMVLGVTAYSILTWQFVLSARPKFIERNFGMDKLYRIHGLVAFLAIVMVFLHKTINETIFTENLMTQLGTISLITYAAISTLTILLMINSFVVQIQPFKAIKQWIAKLNILRYQHYRLLHNLTLVGLVLMQIHVLMTSTAHQSVLVFNAFMAYFLIGLSFYLYHKWVKPWVHQKDMYEVSKVVEETSNIVSIYFEPTSGKIFKYRPGQFGFFRFLGTGISDEEHPFSISSSPTQAQLSITVKDLGDYTRTIKNVKAGNLLQVEAPFGRFSYTHHMKASGHVFIVGGIGITPVLSMLRHMRDTQFKKPVVLIWGLNTMSDYVCLDEFKGMIQQMPNLKVIPIIAKDPNYLGEKGYVDADKLKRLLLPLAWITTAEFYVCGPAPLMEPSLKNLKAMGISKHHIHHEKFSL